MEKISLKDYLSEREKKLDNLKKEVSFLKKIKIPLKIYKQGNNTLLFFSEDYSLATDFEIKKRDGRCNVGGSSDYDGGYYYYVNDFYPQFYFNLKNEEKSVLVYIQHKNFDEDENIVFRRIKGCTGSGDYTNKTNRTAEYIDIKKVFSYFEKKGVKKELISRLEKKIEEIEKY